MDVHYHELIINTVVDVANKIKRQLQKILFSEIKYNKLSSKKIQPIPLYIISIIKWKRKEEILRIVHLLFSINRPALLIMIETQASAPNKHIFIGLMRGGPSTNRQGNCL
mgnify:CR=1 FL=1